MREMTKETFYIINQKPKINRAHWNLPWMSWILKFWSLKISLETLERSLHHGEKTEISRKASWDIWNSPFLVLFKEESHCLVRLSSSSKLWGVNNCLKRHFRKPLTISRTRLSKDPVRFPARKAALHLTCLLSAESLNNFGHNIN